MVLTIDDDDGDNNHKSFDSVPCSICLEAVTNNGDRSFAKLQCGHQFHLDCIGSAFNIKGAMQCPNCRKIEKGQWLYANGSRSHPESSMEDWTREEELYDLSYSEMSLGVHWCPFGNFTRLPSSFEEQEFSSTAYHDVVGQHAMFAEHSGVSSGSHPCPHIAYFGPAHPSTSTSGGTVSEASNFNHWNGHGDMSTPPYTIPAVVLHYHSWDHHSSHFSSASSHLGAADQPSVSPSNQRPARSGSELPRSGSYMHPFLVGPSHSSARVGNSVASSMIPPYQGSNARARDRVQALQAYYQPQQPPNSTTIRTPVATSTRRSSSHSGSAPLVASRPDQSPSYAYVPLGLSGRNFQEETHLSSHFHSWERDHMPSSSLNQVGRESSWRAYHQTASGSDPGIGSTSFRLRNDSERMPSQNR